MLAIRRGRTESWMQWIPCYKCCKDYISENFPCQLANGNMCVNVHARVPPRRGVKAKQTYGMLVFYIIADMSQRRCLFPALRLFDQCLQYCTWQEKRTQKCTEGCQLEEFTDPVFYFPRLSSRSGYVSKRSMHWENENVYLVFFHTILTF